MKNHGSWSYRCARALSACLAVAALAAAGARAVPTVDGTRDAEYVLVSSPNPSQDVSGNLTQVSGLNDETDPRARNLDVARVYAANTSTALYFFIELPNLDLDTVYGDWSMIMHLGGANDGLGVDPLTTDPYAESIYLGYSTAGQVQPNAVIKANFRSGAANSQDGMNGWSDLVLVSATNMWDFGDDAGTRNLFGMQSNTPLPAGTATVSGTGATGAQIIYKENVGIELSVPLVIFGQNPNSAVTAPVVGDTIKLQFLATTRRGGFTEPNQHLRGAIDTFPYDPSARKDPDASDPNSAATYARGLTTIYGTYTLSAPTTFEVVGARYRDASHLTVTFSDPVGNGAATAMNYTVVDQSNASAIAVVAAEVNPEDNKQVLLTTAPLPVGRTVRITVNGVYNASGTLISSTKNIADAAMPTPVVFRLYDPGNLAAGRPVTLTGNFTNWSDGDGQVAMNPVSGQPNRYESPVVLILPGAIEYKYRVPSDPNAWNLLNPDNRQATVPVQESNFIVNDSILVPVMVTFHLYDPEAKADGRQVTVTGEFLNWNTGEAEVKLNPVGGQPNVYESAPVPILPNLQNGYIEYKYRVPEDPNPWDVLNYGGPPNRRVTVPATSGPITTNDIVPTSVPVDVTFELVDVENRLQGRDVYVTGRFTTPQWTLDPFNIVKLDPVPGQANTYRGVTSITQGYTTFKFITDVRDDPNNPGQYLANLDLFGQNDRFANIIGSGSPLAQTVRVSVGAVTPPAIRILRIAGGLEAAPASLAGLDMNNDQKITIADAVAAAKGQ